MFLCQNNTVTKKVLNLISSKQIIKFENYELK